MVVLFEEIRRFDRLIRDDWVIFLMATLGGRRGHLSYRYNTTNYARSDIHSVGNNNNTS